MALLVGFVLACLVAQWSAYAAARRSSRAGTMCTIVLLGALCTKAALDGLPHVEQALFPWPGYALVQPLVLYAIAATFFGVAQSRLPVRWNRIVVALVGIGVIAYGAHRNAWIASPQDHGRVAFADADHHLQQSTHYTCGPAACVAALSHCGVRISEREMARLCLTRTQGSRLFDLYRGVVLALEGHPFEVSIRALTPDEVMQAGRILVSSNRGGGHAVCIVGRGADALVHDPLDKAPEVWDRSRVRRDYRSPAIVIEPDPVARLPSIAAPR